MNTSECSFCGMPAIVGETVCATCKLMLEPAETKAVSAAPLSIEIETFAQVTSINEPVLDTSFRQPNADFQQPDFEQPVNDFQQPYQPQESALPPPPPRNSYQSFPRTVQAPPSPAICLKCGNTIPRFQRQCLACQRQPVKKKRSVLKILLTIIVLAVAAGGGSFYYFENYTPTGFLYKYARATGADKSMIYENFQLNGSMNVSVEGVPMPEQNFTFVMVFKKPNKSAIQLYKPSAPGSGGGGGTTMDIPVFVQAFDGVKGWKYTNMFGKSGYEETGDAFGEKEMGMGLGDYLSVEFMNAATRAEYGGDIFQAFDAITTFHVNDIPKPSAKKVYMTLKKKKPNGETDDSLLVFDEKTGFLLGLVKKSKSGMTTVISKIFADKYKIYMVKKQGLFGGVDEERILVPTSWKFKMSPPSPSAGPTVVMDMTVEKLKVDTQIDDMVFVMQGK